MADFNFSVFAAGPEGIAEESTLLDLLRDALDRLSDPEAWKSVPGGMWCQLTPVGGHRRPQGWKLHVSATRASAADVLERSLPVLLAARSPFKFASTLDHAAALNARNTSRGHSGKFITVYPETDEEAVRLAKALHEATLGLAGPRVLSDRPYASGSLVHYRYGAFVEERRLTNDGFYAWVILDPDGNPVEDRRQGTYTAPSWAVCPFPDTSTQERPAAGREKPAVRGGPVLLGGRFAVREAIRHTNKGGVYRAQDTRTGAMVVIKEARPHVAADEYGRDTRDRLRAEVRALERLADLGVAARPVEVFTQGGHLFLAEEMIPGVPLRQWVPDLLNEAGLGGHFPMARDMALRLADVLATAHDAGVVLGDFNPNNVIVRPDGNPVLIDLELATVDDSDDEAVRAGTPGFGAPEQWEGAAPARSVDYYSFGATLCYLFAGDAPYLVVERPNPNRRPRADRTAEWLSVRNLPAGLSRMILDLMADDPEKRPVPTREALASMLESAPTTNHPPNGLADQRDLCQTVVRGLTGHLLATMTPGDSARLWPASCAHGAPDPCCLQHGAAGTLGVLTRCYELTGNERIPDAVAAACRWISHRLDETVKRPPGLYFGTAGAAWALLEAGCVLDEKKWRERGLLAASALPITAPSPDITHGTAGIGLTALHAYVRTGETHFRERALAAADELLATAEERAGVLGLATPADADSKLAGKRYFGFAHGIAGVGYFLQSCARATDRDDLLGMAVRVGDTLLDHAVITDGTARWGTGTGDAPTAPYWCHGAAGIATFLVRLHQTTGDERFGRTAAMAAQSVVGNSWRGVLGQCHGLAGNGDFLLDMVQATGEEHYETAAWHLGSLIMAARADRDGNLVLPDETGELSTTWGGGMSGMLAFLLRLSYGSPRQWMEDGARP